MGILGFAFAAALATSGLLAFPVRRLVLCFGIVDRPNARSSHHVPIPRAGGLAIVLGIAVTIPVLVPLDLNAAGVGLLIAVVTAPSFLDDIRGLSFKTRLVAQTAAAAAVVVLIGLPVRALDLPGASLELPSGLGMALAVLFVVASCNFFNFMDGINGLAAGQAALTGATLSAILHRAGCGPAAVVAAAVAGAAAGFLPHNFPAARVFMGDVGSVTLGFLLALLSQAAHSRGGAPWTAVVLVHAAFLFDTVFTLGKRAWRGESLVSPHREHNYQLLVRDGWSHTASTLTVLAVSAGCCAAAYLYAWSRDWIRWAALLSTATVLTSYALAAHRRRVVLQRFTIGLRTKLGVKPRLETWERHGHTLMTPLTDRTTSG